MNCRKRINQIIQPVKLRHIAKISSVKHSGNNIRFFRKNSILRVDSELYRIFRKQLFKLIFVCFFKKADYFFRFFLVYVNKAVRNCSVFVGKVYCIFPVFRENIEPDCFCKSTVGIKLTENQRSVIKRHVFGSHSVLRHGYCEIAFSVSVEDNTIIL